MNGTDMFKDRQILVANSFFLKLNKVRHIYLKTCRILVLPLVSCTSGRDSSAIYPKNLKKRNIPNDRLRPIVFATETFQWRAIHQSL